MSLSKLPTLREVCTQATEAFANRRSAASALRIAVLTPKRVQTLGAGDWKQAERTVEAMRGIGLKVTHILLERGTCVDFYGYDVLHFMPSHGTEAFQPRPAKSPLIVASSVYWDSWRHRWITEPALRRRYVAVAKYLFLRAMKAGYLSNAVPEQLSARFRESAARFLQCSLILPNSVMEAQGLYRHFTIQKTTQVCPIPNGVDPPPDHAWRAVLPATFPQSGYVLYPGVFAHRKNQLGFIRATQNTPWPVVFMGGPVNTTEAQQYYQACRQEARPHHLFAGHVEHRSELFYALMRHARVCCLASSCETPGIAALESAVMGARVAITREGGAEEYLNEKGIYFSPVRGSSIRAAVQQAWDLGRDETQGPEILRLFSWTRVAQCTVLAYLRSLERPSD